MKVKLDTLSAEDATVMKVEAWIKYLSTETASIISDSIKRSSFFKEYAIVAIFSDVENYEEKSEDFVEMKHVSQYLFNECFR